MLGATDTKRPASIVRISLAILPLLPSPERAPQPARWRAELALRGDMRSTLFTGQLARCIRAGGMAGRILVDSVRVGNRLARTLN